MRELTPESTKLFPRKFTEMPEIVRGEGAYIYDSNGNEYFDAVGGNQCSNIGHGVTEIADAAAEQMKQLEYTSSILFVNDQSQAFAERMAEFLPEGFEHTWMVSGGSEANESAIKMAREYHRETGNPEKQMVIGRRLAFHGNTLGTLATAGLPARREPFVPMMKDWPHAPAAYPYRCRFCDDEASCGEHGAECAKQLETVIRDAGPEYVAAFIAEPVVGAANAAAVPGDEYFDVVREICDEYDVLFIADEVMSGMGRTGENFAMEHWDVRPDIFTSAKGMSAGYTPLGGAMPRDYISEVFADKEDGFTHGHTYSFNPTTSAVASAVLDYMNEHDVVENVREVGGHVTDRFEEFYDYDFVGDVRGKGLMLGVEFVEDRETKEPLENGGPEFREQLLHTALDNGVTVYPGGGSVDGERGDHMLITPPLTISREEADEMVDRLHATFQDLDPLSTT
ncbi:aspartate aminotransferase family protein [Haloplanus sp. GCM10025708]|uniref:aminotransferase family protein n=1 Tax=Haloferacaceae TaxID=1644056 RepID=UPI00360DCA08